MPHDIQSKADCSRHCAMPIYVRRLLVRDLLICIASLKVACNAAISTDGERSFPHIIAEVPCLVECRASTPSVPALSI